MDGVPTKKLRRIVDDDDDDEDLPDITEAAFLNPPKAPTPLDAEVKEDHESDDAGLFSGDDEDEAKEPSQSPSKKRYNFSQ